MDHLTFDVIVIGAGSAGLTIASGLAKAGRQVLLVEREHLGGECTNTGCIPSKALLHHARTYYQSQRLAGSTTASEAYRTEAFSYVRRKITAVLAEETAAHFAALGIKVVMGEAVFTGNRTVVVGDHTYTFKQAIIATGSAPRMIDIPGLPSEHILTNQNLFQLDTIPNRSLVIGAGPIGLEMGQALALLGSQVTIATIDDTFIRLEDPALRPLLADRFTELDIRIELGASIQSAANHEALFHRQTNGAVTDTLTIPFDRLLLAIGRTPNLPAGLKAAGVTYDQRGITTNSQFQTTNPRIYAIGDVANALKFTHTADDAARRLLPRLLSGGLWRVRASSAVPKVTYTDPEMAQVGQSWEQAVASHEAKYLHRLEIPLQSIDRAITDDVSSGHLVVIAKRLTGEIVGAHYLGPRAGEIIAIFTLAIDQHISLWKLGRSVYAYPTYAVLVKKASDTFLATQLTTWKADLYTLACDQVGKIVAIVVWIAGLLLLYNYLHSSGATATELALNLFNFMTTTAWGPVLYILAYTLRPLTFLPGTAMTILSGVFFGLWGGIIYTIIGANLSAIFAYAIGRFFSQRRPLEIGAIARLRALLSGSPFLSTLITRLTFFPFDLINYGAGLLKIPFLPYLAGTFVGTLLGIATFVSIGASVHVEDIAVNGLSSNAINGQFILLSLGIFVISVAISKILAKQQPQ